MKTNLVVELFYSGAWHNITATNDVSARQPITITRGRPDEVSHTPPSMLTLAINNPSGKYSPRNPMSPLYGLIGRNTPIRVKVDGEFRFWGEIESWPQQWNVTGSDVWASVTAYGILRRLNTPGTVAPSVSAMRRAITQCSPAPVAYWPLEDGSLISAPTALFGSPLVAQPASQFSHANTGLVSGGVDGPPGGGRAADLSGGGQLAGSVAGTSGTSWRIGFAFKYNNPLVTGDSGDIITMRTVDAGGASGWWRFSTSTDGADNWVWEWGIESVSTILDGTSPGLDDGAWHWVEIAAQDGSGTNTTYTVTIDGVLVVNEVNRGAVKAGKIQSIVIADSGDLSAAAHVVVWPTNAALSVDTYGAFRGFAGETAAARITRLCTEEGIAITIIGDPDLSEAMGVQRVAPFLDLLRDGEDADDGILFEPRDGFGFNYRVHENLYNQTPTLTLNYAAGGEVAPPLLPVEDTDATVNDVTVIRYQGAAGGSQLVQETGPLNVQEPPVGVGRVPKEFTLVLDTEAQTLQQAGWKRHLGTWDEARYPVVKLDITAMLVDGKTILAAAAADLDIGDRFTITNPPPWLPPDTIALHVQGFTEVPGTHHRTIDINATPARTYDVAVLEDTVLGRLDNDACTLTEDLDTTETGVDVVSVNTEWGNDFPYDIGIGGEKMTVTARSGAGLTQTLTVVRSVNGVVKTHTSGVQVGLWQPMRLAR